MLYFHFTSYNILSKVRNAIISYVEVVVPGDACMLCGDNLRIGHETANSNKEGHENCW